MNDARENYENVEKVLQMGPGTFPVPLSLFAENRKRLITKLQKTDTPRDSCVLLEGGTDISLYDTDTQYIFKQESYFMWTFGVLESGCFGAISLDTEKSILFVPELPADYAVWMGPLLTLQDFKDKYEVDEVYYVKQIEEILIDNRVKNILVLSGVNSDSNLKSHEANFAGIEKFKIDTDILFPIIAELRVIKTAKELEVLKYVIKVSSDAHKKVMKFVRPGYTEYMCEAVFLEHCYRVGGCRHVSYTCICGTGTNSAILHYGHAGAPNDRIIKSGDMCLFDMGANYFGYAADITCSFPANGKFTKDQKLIYNAVLSANNSVLHVGTPGFSWVTLHQIAARTLLEELKKGGLLQGSVDEMMSTHLYAIFQPHGLGHLMGLDVHDVGGYLPGHPERPKEDGIRCLRTARELEINMVLTVEPGCYFIKPLLEKAYAHPVLSKFLVKKNLARFHNFGGVRIEDDVVVTRSGLINLTDVPRTVEEIEEFMAQTNELTKSKVI